MIYAILGLLLGGALGYFAPGYIPKDYVMLFSVALMAGLDTAFGGLRAAMEGNYDDTVFISGFLINILLSVPFALVWLAAIIVAAKYGIENFDTLKDQTHGFLSPSNIRRLSKILRQTEKSASIQTTHPSPFIRSMSSRSSSHRRFMSRRLRKRGLSLDRPMSAKNRPEMSSLRISATWRSTSAIYSSMPPARLALKSPMASRCPSRLRQMLQTSWM